MVKRDLPCCSSSRKCLFARDSGLPARAERALGLRNVHTISVRKDVAEGKTPTGRYCTCATPTAPAASFRKKPCRHANMHWQGGLTAGVTGRKRFQSGRAAQSAVSFEVEAPADASRTDQVNPLAHLGMPLDVSDTSTKNRLAPAPAGLPKAISIAGLARPAPPRVKPGERPRAGRWRNMKKEGAVFILSMAMMVLCRSKDMTQFDQRSRFVADDFTATYRPLRSTDGADAGFRQAL